MCLWEYLNLTKKSNIKGQSAVRSVLLVDGLSVVANHGYHPRELVEKRVQTLLTSNYHRKPQINHTYSFYHFPIINHTNRNVPNPLNIKSIFLCTATFEVNSIVEHVYADESVCYLNEGHNNDHGASGNKTDIRGDVPFGCGEVGGGVDGFGGDHEGGGDNFSHGEDEFGRDQLTG